MGKITNKWLDIFNSSLNKRQKKHTVQQKIFKKIKIETDEKRLQMSN